MSDNYVRVIPRDFFNEAKLLKCMGHLSLAVLDRILPDGINIEILDSIENDSQFNIKIIIYFYILYVSNYTILINGKSYILGTRYNSKQNFPFYIIIDDQDFLVFDEQGDLSEEFINKFQIKEHVKI